MIKLKKVSKSYSEKTVLSGIDLTVEKGEKLVLMGSSGIGKTTLLRIACGLEKQDSGEVTVDGKISVVFQEDRLFSQLTVYDNVYCICKDREKTKNVLEGVGLWEDREKYPDELSGGMARRVSIARAVSYDHDILLLDEPFKGLDEATRNIVIKNILEYEKGKTMLVITHDKTEAELLGARIAELENQLQ